MKYLELLQNSYEMERRIRSDSPESPLVYLSDYIFDFTTYDDEMSELFAQKAVEVCKAITDGTTFDFIKDPENYRWYLLMCNLPFFASKLEWGGSIRGAWWDNEITFRSCVLWDGDKQLVDEITFTHEEWSIFIKAVIEFSHGSVVIPS